MSRRDAKDKIVRALEIVIEILGAIVMLAPLWRRKPKKKQPRS